MAQAIICDFCQELPAAFLIGNVKNGNQEAACEMCIVQWARNLVTQFDQFMGEADVIATVALDGEGLPVAAADAGAAVPGDPVPARPKRARKSAPKPGTAASSPSSNGRADSSVVAGPEASEGAS